MAKPATKPPAKPKKTVEAAAAKMPAPEAGSPAAPASPKAGMTLHELAAAILSAAHVPSAEEVKALAASVLKHIKPSKDKKAKKAKAKDGKKDKPKADKKGKNSAKTVAVKQPKVKLPKLRGA